MDKTDPVAELRYGGKTFPYPVVEGTEGEKAIDITKLRAQTGLVTLDPGYGNTGACESSITFIDGEKGILRYRGYPIDELAAKSTFLEVSQLLIHGELPPTQQLDAFKAHVTRHTMLREDMKKFFESMPKDAHPMPVLAAAVSALAAFYEQPETEEEIGTAVVRLLAKMPTLAAWAYKHSIGQPFVYPRNDLDYASNLLHMMYATPCEPYRVDPVAARAIDVLLILHADHEQNCSTSTVRLVGSSRAHLYASIAAGISALWGPLHGGANQEVIEMLEAIKKEHGSAERFLERAKDKNDTTRLMGFGHRVYKSYDPRAAILKRTCKDRDEARGDHAQGRLLHQPEALPERGLLLGRHLPGARHPDRHVHRDVRAGAPAGLDRPVDRDAAGSRLPHRPSPPDLHGGGFRIGRPRQIYTGATERHLQR